VTLTTELAPDYDPSPYILQGQDVFGRETFEEWTTWRAARDAFVRAPRLSVEKYRDLPPRRKMLYDLHRIATNANLPIHETPMSRELAALLEPRFMTNSLMNGPETRDGVMVTGGGFQGKTEAVCRIAAGFEEFWLNLHEAVTPGTRDLVMPVAYVHVPITATPKSTCQAILDFYGLDLPDRTTLPRLLKAVRTCIRGNKTTILILDDINRLKIHRADDQDTLDMIRGLMDMHVTLVLVGVNIPGSGLLRHATFDRAANQWVLPARHGDKSYNSGAETQHERRFDLVDFDRFRYDSPEEIEAWVSHLLAVEEQLCLLRAEPGMLTTGDTPEYLYRRTGGIVGVLSRLIKAACVKAIALGDPRGGEEHLTRALLEDTVIDLRDADRDAESGEYLDLSKFGIVGDTSPTLTTTTAPPRRRARRNGSFDDTGAAA